MLMRETDPGEDRAKVLLQGRFWRTGLAMTFRKLGWLKIALRRVLRFSHE